MAIQRPVWILVNHERKQRCSLSQFGQVRNVELLPGTLIEAFGMAIAKLSNSFDHTVTKLILF
jgi:hypothetical protein